MGEGVVIILIFLESVSINLRSRVVRSGTAQFYFFPAGTLTLLQQRNFTSRV